MATLVGFLDVLIYGTLAEAVITPNHRDWLASGKTGGTDWISHYVDTTSPNSLLSAFEGWLAANNWPPLVPWDGTNFSPFDPQDNLNGAQGVPLATGLDGSFTSIATLDDLGKALAQQYRNLRDQFAFGAPEGGVINENKLPYDFRFWSFLKWAAILVQRFNGLTVVPPGIMYDRDGTILSAMPFLNVVNEVHWRWHDNSGPHGLNLNGGSPTGTTNTPGYNSTVGQRVTAIDPNNNSTIGEEFFRFHRDHVYMLDTWLGRLGQPPITTINMAVGWPQPGQASKNPSAWTEPTSSPFINAEGGDTNGQLRTQETSLNQMGFDVMTVHAAGHNNNTDIIDALNNNYSPRFFAWHTWVDSQWWWREPHFAHYNATTRQRERTFKPALIPSNSDWPGLPVLTLVRDPNAAADSVLPANALSGLNLTTGAGTLRMQFFVKDPYGRNLTLKLKAEVFNDAVSTSVPVETIPESTNTYLVGAGGTFSLENLFTVDFTFAGAFKSDDPARVKPAVGFINSRIRISGSLAPADGSDTGFVHQDYAEILLIQEKVAPGIDLAFNLSTFGDDQVQSAMQGGQARFTDALIVSVQDQTSRPAAVPWPATTADEVKGILQGITPAAGLFNDTTHAPQPAIEAKYTGVNYQLAGPPTLEDPSLPDNLPQRYTYHYDLVFQTNNNAFTGLQQNSSQAASLTVTAADRAGNQATATGSIRFVRAATPYMVKVQGDNPAWLAIDTRVFQRFENDNFQGVPLTPGQPVQFIQQVIAALNNTALPQATRNSWFDNLPTDEDQSALEFSTSITDHVTNVTRNVFNFALAKVRLQGVNGASGVRVFFRLFKCNATNLTYDSNLGYRFYDVGGSPDVKVPLLGFSAAGDVISVPFFASGRVVPSADMKTQPTDTTNVQDFPAGSTSEQVLYFGAYLDINQDSAQLPATRIAAHPDGGFTPQETQPIRSIFLDLHTCMVVEIKFDPDPSVQGDTPADSALLAQRNLAIVKTDNPGSSITHTVEHSFLVDLTPPATDVGARAAPSLVPIPPAERNRLVQALATEIATPEIRRLMSRDERQVAAILAKARKEASDRVARQNPFIFDPVTWTSTHWGVDELLFRWNRLPMDSHVELYLPNASCEQVMNLRALRHAPGDVKIIDSHRLLLIPGGSTYIPLPPVPERRVAGVVAITLPAEIKRGQKWLVDVLQLAGRTRQVTGAFRIDIQVSTAALIADAELRLLDVMYERLALAPPASLWQPVLAKRVATIRARAEALAARAGLPFTDPTQWIDSSGASHPLNGQRIRVFLERIEVNSLGRPPSQPLHGLRLFTRVRTDDNGMIEQRHVLPAEGAYPLSGSASTTVLSINAEIFRGYVEDDLAIQIKAREETCGEKHALPLCRYRRLLTGPVTSFLGYYRPNDEPIDPENVGAWEVWYRIERA
jgi:hypothetical protein